MSSYADIVYDGSQSFFSNAGYVGKLCNGCEWAVAVPIVENSLGQNRSDTGEGLQICQCSGVEIDQSGIVLWNGHNSGIGDGRGSGGASCADMNRITSEITANEQACGEAAKQKREDQQKDASFFHSGVTSLIDYERKS